MLQILMKEARKSQIITQNDFPDTELVNTPFSIEIPMLSRMDKFNLQASVINKDGTYNILEFNRKYFTEHGTLTDIELLDDDGAIIPDEKIKKALLYDFGDARIVAKVDEVIRDITATQEVEKKTEAEDLENTQTGL